VAEQDHVNFAFRLDQTLDVLEVAERQAPAPRTLSSANTSILAASTAMNSPAPRTNNACPSSIRATSTFPGPPLIITRDSEHERPPIRVREQPR
jgi:hypothetical protein